MKPCLLIIIGAHWNRYYKTNDLEETAAKDGSYHLHMAGTEWLTYFKQTNLNLLNKLDVYRFTK